MKSMLGLLTLLLLFPAIANSQAAGLTTGARVRVTSPPDAFNKHVTTVIEVRQDSIVVASRSGQRTVALGNITALDVSTGKRGHMLRDGAIGLGIGAVLGGVLMKAAYDDCGGGAYGAILCGAPVSESEGRAIGAAVYGGLGLLAGVAVGAFWDRSDRWESRHAAVKATIAPSRSGGVALSFSTSF